jgi:predicted small metal-binding protein
VKKFSCGDVVPGCARTFTARDSDGIVTQVAGHARHDHGLSDVPAELVGQVLLAIREAV